LWNGNHSRELKPEVRSPGLIHQSGLQNTESGKIEKKKKKKLFAKIFLFWYNRK
jgi:hypothetical protein